MGLIQPHAMMLPLPAAELPLRPAGFQEEKKLNQSG